MTCQSSLVRWLNLNGMHMVLSTICGCDIRFITATDQVAEAILSKLS
jgi:arginine repressor